MIEGRDFGAASTVGARARQEDDWGTHVTPPSREAGARLLATVADGMGGMPAGDEASGIALRAFLDSYRAIDLPASERLRHALAHANREVGIAVEGNPSLDGMGCTLVSALFFADRCEWLSVGDSLILLVRDGGVNRVNPLHVYANKLDERVCRGDLSEQAAREDPDRAALTSAIQGSYLEEVAQGTLALEPGDLLILASDGILTLTAEELVSICADRASDGAESVARATVERIDAAGQPNQDNATLIVVHHDFATSDQTDASGESAEATAIVERETDDVAAAPCQPSDGVAPQESPGDSVHETTTPARSVADPADEVTPGALDASRTGHPEEFPDTQRPHRKPARNMRLFSLTAAFALGALCGAAVRDAMGV